MDRGNLLYITSPRSGTHYLWSVLCQYNLDMFNAENITHFHTTSFLDKDQLDSVFTHAVLLMRQDTLRQAISLIRESNDTKRISYHRHEEGGVIPEIIGNISHISAVEILELQDFIIKSDKSCFDVLAKSNIPVLSLFYEEVCLDVYRNVQRVFRFLDKDIPERIDTVPDICIQRDIFTEMLYRECAQYKMGSLL